MGAEHSKKVFKPVVISTFKAALGNSKDVGGLMTNAMEKLQECKGDLEVLQKQQAERLTEENKKHLGPIFDEFDKDGNGVLDHKECQMLLKASLAAQKKYAPPLMYELIANMLKPMLDIMKAMGMPSSQIEKVKKEARSTADKVFGESIDALMKDHVSISNTLFEKMDADKNGTVSRQEFQDNYFLASTQSINATQFLPQSLPGCSTGGAPADADCNMQ